MSFPLHNEGTNHTAIMYQNLSVILKSQLLTTFEKVWNCPLPCLLKLWLKYQVMVYKNITIELEIDLTYQLIIYIADDASHIEVSESIPGEYSKTGRRAYRHKKVRCIPLLLLTRMYQAHITWPLKLRPIQEHSMSGFPEERFTLLLSQMDVKRVDKFVIKQTYYRNPSALNHRMT